MGKRRVEVRGCMTVGQAAKKGGVTVRTLQYYDKEGLLSPTAVSEAGEGFIRIKMWSGFIRFCQ